jgi:ADP-heptose:LPS heptosyltransferase
LTIPEVKPLAERCPHANVIRTLDLRQSRSGLTWVAGQRRRELWQLIREFREAEFDLAVNLYAVESLAGALRTAALFWLIGARCTLGRWSGGYGVAYDLQSRQEGHEIDAQLGVVRLAGITPRTELPELWIRVEDEATCALLLKAHGVSPGERIACMHPGSAKPETRWPSDRFAVVGQHLVAAGARLVLIGAPGQEPLCESLAEAVPGAISLAGATSLPVLAALLQRAALLVTNDSGPMHMAAALGTPVVVPFGPATPDRFGPRGRAGCFLFTGCQPTRGPWWEGVSAATVAESATRVFLEASGALGAPVRQS